MIAACTLSVRARIEAVPRGLRAGMWHVTGFPVRQAGDLVVKPILIFALYWFERRYMIYLLQLGPRTGSAELPSSHANNARQALE